MFFAVWSILDAAPIKWMIILVVIAIVVGLIYLFFDSHKKQRQEEQENLQELVQARKEREEFVEFIHTFRKMIEGESPLIGMIDYVFGEDESRIQSLRGCWGGDPIKSRAEIDMVYLPDESSFRVNCECSYGLHTEGVVFQIPVEDNNIETVESLWIFWPEALEENDGIYIDENKWTEPLEDYLIPSREEEAVHRFERSIWREDEPIFLPDFEYVIHQIKRRDGVLRIFDLEAVFKRFTLGSSVRIRMFFHHLLPEEIEVEMQFFDRQATGGEKHKFLLETETIHRVHGILDTKLFHPDVHQELLRYIALKLEEEGNDL